MILILPIGLLAQSDSSAYRIQDVDAHFLMHYYSQDGVHSAVQGGEGPEDLTDVQGKIIINILTDSVKSFNMKLGVNHYTSASTDQIDRVMSSASRKDSRAQIDLSYGRSFKKADLTFYGSASIESDYFSAMAGFSIFKEIQKGNAELGFTNKSYFDNWVIILPVELRGASLPGFETSKRNSSNNSLTYWQAVNKKLSFSIDLDLIYQYGLLSTPFHRVYFENDSLSVERLPDSRFRYPVTFKLSYYPNNVISVQMLYRFYNDDFKISSHTAEIALPVMLSNRFSIEPFYRFYSQSASAYFQAYGEHSINSNYQTSDYDLSEFKAHKLGASLNYSPVWRFFEKKDQTFATIQTLSFRYAYYSREDGLFYNVASAGVRFKL
ncbi:MAG: DUF3570 domain-containing protein [Chitinophagales bacterium]|nr:DUF3570 domain-containing protein [Chitinophagales bacterium]